jgi:uncharacterized membrane protein YdjX (TVP38/TMEM64 family)
MLTLIRRHVYAAVFAALVLLFLATFAVVEQSQLPLLTDSRPGLTAGPWMAGVIGVGLLLADVVLPVPSSGVMVVHGAVYGVVIGSILSLLGGTGATVVAFLLGRRSRATLERLAGPEQQARATALLDRFGIWAVLLTRPVPVLAETVAIMAGTGRLGWWQATWAGALGTLLPAVGYAAAGTLGATLVG